MRKAITFRLLIVISILLIVVVYFSPVWWASLKGPNYSYDTFPYGVRIHFHVNGVFNGCPASQSIDSINCVYKIETINYNVGMYPIAYGGII
jgi:hypothetical protein